MKQNLYSVIRAAMVVAMAGSASAIFCPVHELTPCGRDSNSDSLKFQVDKSLNRINCIKVNDYLPEASSNLYMDFSCDDFGKSAVVNIYKKSSSGINCFGFDKEYETTIAPC